MEDKQIPYIVYESTIARFERTVKRLIVVIAILAVLLFASNMAWLYEWNQYEYKEVNIDNQDGGNANYIGASGVINNAEDNSSNENKEE